ncbi:MAG: hypothetical protein Q8P39_04010 [Candidatus Yanofskybacteria bacterium]|nr:hypothetical protein [Candidatus Yanofskybacteria bacterium]
MSFRVFAFVAAALIFALPLIAQFASAFAPPAVAPPGEGSIIVPLREDAASQEKAGGIWVNALLAESTVRMEPLARPACSAGIMYFDKDEKRFYVCNGTAWRSLAP